MLKPYSPFALLDELNALLEDPIRQRDHHFSYSIESNDESLTLSVDVPGIKKDDLKVSITGHIINISGTRAGKERTQQYSISKMYDPSTVDAKHEDGVLTLRFKCSEKVKLRQIDVKIS